MRRVLNSSRGGKSCNRAIVLRAFAHFPTLLKAFRHCLAAGASTRAYKTSGIKGGAGQADDGQDLRKLELGQSKQSGAEVF